MSIVNIVLWNVQIQTQLWLVDMKTDKVLCWDGISFSGEMLLVFCQPILNNIKLNSMTFMKLGFITVCCTRLHSL